MAMQARQYEGTITLAEFYTGVSGTIPSITTGTFGSVVVTLPAGSQAAPGDFVQIGQPAAWGPLIIDAAITAPGVVTISAYNASGSTVNVGAQLFNILIERCLLQGN